MATVIPDQPGPARPVNWAAFADGATWELRRGVDFEQPPSIARRAFISWARRHGFHTSTHVPDERTLQVRVLTDRPEGQK